jgi:hypothetical protein
MGARVTDQPLVLEASGTARQSEIVAAINGPTCCGQEVKSSIISRAHAWARVW